MTQAASILIQGLELKINLGWTPDEQAKVQTIMLNITLAFLEPLPACLSDNLDDTICYDQLIRKIKSALAAKHFRLIEHVGFEVYQLIKNTIPIQTHVTTQITKKPKIEGLTGGVTFSYGD